MTYWNAVLLGLVQGVAEFLPISSSGHLAVLQNFLAIGDNSRILEGCARGRDGVCAHAPHPKNPARIEAQPA